ncbi:type I methionyl aminopeptidase [Candidatus Gottesmanbacteria bacterium]|nr:type I methionyl aminopeptidase [Candidatus Gottesmanbacteria bacterium]
MIDSKTPQDIAVMVQGGKRLGNILAELLRIAQPGIPLLEIDARASDFIKKSGGTASFKTVRDYKWATCLCVNEVVVHGIPTPYVLKDGDVLTIDIGLLYEGLHTDTAWTKITQNSKLKTQNSEEKEKFLNVGEEALWKAIEQATIGNRVGHISKTIQEIIEKARYNVVKTLVGHGVGKTLHEEPQIPGILKLPLEKTQELVEGMTIAIEVIYAMGEAEIVYDNNDGWTLASKDRSLTAVFEHTIAITRSGPLVLTKGDK